MRRLVCRGISVTACLLSGVVWAETSYLCPETARLESAVVAPASLPEGFALAARKEPIRLSGISVFDGPPERNAVLIPAAERGDLRRKETVFLWKFEGSYPEGKYVSCDYAQGVLHLHVRVAEAVTQCEAFTARKKPHDTLTARFVCR